MRDSMKRKSTTEIKKNNYKIIKKDRDKQSQKWYLYNEFKQTLIIVKLFRDHSRGYHKGEHKRPLYSVYEALEEKEQRKQKRKLTIKSVIYSYIQYT